MVVNVCPAAITSAPPDRVWRMLDAPERYGEWTDATFLSADPPGPVTPGQTIHLTAASLGRGWPVTIEVRDVDPQHSGSTWLRCFPLGSRTTST